MKYALALAIVLLASTAAFAERPTFRRSVRVERTVVAQRARGPVFAGSFGRAMLRSARIDHRAFSGR